MINIASLFSSSTIYIMVIKKIKKSSVTLRPIILSNINQINSIMTIVLKGNLVLTKLLLVQINSRIYLLIIITSMIT